MREKFEDKLPTPKEKQEVKEKKDLVACLSCGREEEPSGYGKYGLPKKPKGWKKYHGHLFCPDCVEKGYCQGYKNW
jgi:hypothetical protein